MRSKAKPIDADFLDMGRPADKDDRAARVEAVALARIASRKRLEDARARLPERRRETTEKLTMAKARLAAKRLNST